MNNPRKNPNCDNEHCREPHGEIRVLPTGPKDPISGDGCSNALLCRACFDHEIRWRKERNSEVWKPFDLPTWESLRIYETD